MKKLNIVHKCKRCKGKIELYHDFGVPREILVQPCKVCEKQIRDGAMNYAWKNPHTEDMGR